MKILQNIPELCVTISTAENEYYSTNEGGSG